LYITYESNKDFLLIDNELKKLSDYSQGNSISDYDFNILITFSKNYKIFDLLDMFFAKNNIEVSKILTNLFSSGTKPNEIIGLLNSEIHKVLYIKYLISEGKTNIEISQLSGIKSKYYFGKLFNTAKKIEIKRLLDIQNSLLKFDIKSKSERFNQDLELELMLISK